MFPLKNVLRIYCQFTDVLIRCWHKTIHQKSFKAPYDIILSNEHCFPKWVVVLMMVIKKCCIKEQIIFHRYTTGLRLVRDMHKYSHHFNPDKKISQSPHDLTDAGGVILQETTPFKGEMVHHRIIVIWKKKFLLIDTFF